MTYLQAWTRTTSFFCWGAYVRDIFNCPALAAAHGRASVPIRSKILVFRIFKKPTEPSVRVSIHCHVFSFVLCCHLEFSPQQDLAVSWGSIQMEPAVQNQFWFWEQLPHRNNQRSHWFVPTARELQCEKEEDAVIGSSYRCSGVNPSSLSSQTVQWATTRLWSEDADLAFTMRVWRFGSRTTKWKDSFHWGLALRSHS